MENLKRSLKRLLIRLGILGLVVACGAFAIAQAQKEHAAKSGAAKETENSSAEAKQTPSTEKGDAELRLRQGIATFDPSPASQPSPPVTDETINDRMVVPAQATSDIDSFRDPTSLDSRFSDASAEGTGPAIPDQFTRPSGFGAGEGAVTDASEAPIHDRFATTLPPNAFEADAEGAPDTEISNRFSADQTDPPGLINESDIPALELDNVVSENTEPVPSIDDVLGEASPSPQPLESTTSSGSRFGTGPEPQADVSPTRGNPYRPAASPRTTTPAADVTPQTVEPNQDFANGGSEPLDTEQARFGGLDTYQDTAPADTSPISVATDPSASNGAGKPGPSELEGPQNPSLTIRKIAPRNVRVGAPATFQIQVRNVGQVPAERVLIRDEVPQGTELIETHPQAQPSSDGGMLWTIGTLRPGEDVTVSVKVRPLQEGAIGSVATVTMQAQASVRVDAKKPMLKIEHSAKRQVLVGENVSFAIVLENPGSGLAERVVIEEDVPTGLTHSKGAKLEYEVGSIPAGTSKRLELTLKAAKPGIVENVIRARGVGGLVAEHRTTLEVVAPQLQVKITGPEKRYLDRKATFALAIENAGTADARNVDLVATLPRGLRFVSTNNSGRYDQLTNTIRWSLDRLPARQYGEVKFTAVPFETGELAIGATANASRGLKDVAEHKVAVDGIAALLFEVADQVDPIEVGDATTYQIRVKNQGTKEATNVQFIAMVPAGMKAVAANGPVGYRVEGDRVFFDAINRLPPKGESSYSVRVEGVAEGDKRFRVEMTSDDTRTPVVEEESTIVYAD